MAATAEIIDSIARRLSEGGYKVSREVALPDGPVVKVAASRTYFSWKGLVVLSQHIVVLQLDNARTQDVQELFEAGFRFGKHANWVPLLRGMQFGYMIIPIIVGADPGKAWCSTSPRRLGSTGRCLSTPSLWTHAITRPSTFKAQRPGVLSSFPICGELSRNTSRVVCPAR
jgi:hypothetical protein